MKQNLYLYTLILICIVFVAPLTEDFCGVEPFTHPPDIVETRPPPIVDEDKLREAYHQTDSAILGSKYRTTLISCR